MAHYVASGSSQQADPQVARSYAWVVFALTFGLLISDYMSRQVLNAVFELLKHEWSLSDTQLGALNFVVAAMVGLLTVPLSLLADRWGRIRSLTLMAVLWSLATLACAVSENYPQMFVARMCVGIGEAAYGSVGVAVVLSVFPARLRATVTGAFMAGGMFGSVLGMASGGIVAELLGWRSAFAGMALFGLALAIAYPMIVRESRVDPSGAYRYRKRDRADSGLHTTPGLSPLETLYATRSVWCAYIGSGLQLFIGGSVMAWISSFLQRYHHKSVYDAGLTASGLMLASGVGMILCGVVSDRLCKDSPARKMTLAIAYCMLCCVLLSLAFRQPFGATQIALIAAGMFFAGGTTGPAGAMVANLTHHSIHGTAFAALTFANNLLGLAAGPIITGVLADALGLQHALQLVPLASLGAAAAFLIGKSSYLSDLERTGGRLPDQHVGRAPT